MNLAYMLVPANGCVLSVNPASRTSYLNLEVFLASASKTTRSVCSTSHEARHRSVFAECGKHQLCRPSCARTDTCGAAHRRARQTPLAPTPAIAPATPRLSWPRSISARGSDSTKLFTTDRLF